MPVRKPTASDIDRVQDSLDVLAKAIDDAKFYLINNPWEKSDDKNKAFEFNSKLVDKINVWNESYMSKCGIMDVYESINKNRKKERAGTVSGGISDVLKKI